MIKTYNLFKGLNAEKYDPGYELYCRELEIRYYLESQEFFDELNRDLQDIRVQELEMELI